MLNKLLKYEFKSLGRVLLPIYCATLAMSLITSVLFKIQPDFNSGAFNILKSMALLASVIYGLTIAASLLVSFFCAIYRFKKNIFGDEGYLINTLPVSPWQNIAAKGITAIAYQFVGIIVSAVSGILFIAVISDLSEIDLLSMFSDLLRMAHMYGGSVIGYAVEIILTVISSSLCGMFMIYAAMSIGHSFNTRRVLKSVGAFLGIYVATQLINSVLVCTASNILESLNLVFDATGAFHIMLISVIILESAYAVLYFAITNYFISNRLNLQ